MKKKIEKVILLVEDNDMNMELLLSQFKVAGFSNLLTARNGKEAVELAMEHSPDLILMDNQMPVMNGNEAIIMLKSKGYKGNIITLSAYSMHDDIEKSLSLGAIDYIAKPFSFKTLFKKVYTYLNIDDSDIPINLLNKTENKLTGESKYTIKGSVSQRIKNVFILDLDNKMEKIYKILDKQDLGEGRQKMEIIAHGFKGYSEHLGLPELASSASNLEQRIQNNAPDKEIIWLSKDFVEFLEKIYKNNIS